MSNDAKKISFSFSKVKKSSLVTKPNLEPKEKVDYVDCFDGSKGKFSYKGNVRSDDAAKKELVIPLINSKSSIEILKSRIEEKAGNRDSKNQDLNETSKVDEKKQSDNEENKKSSKSLEELAAREILNDLKNSKNESNNTSSLIIDANGQQILSVAESSEADIDYENVPVSDFGLAMLRGMGWTPNSGIGKEPRMVPTVSPKLRPKGLGLGATPTAEQNTEEKKSKDKTKEKSKEKKVK